MGNGQQQVPGNVLNILLTGFPNSDCLATDFGAVGNGAMDCFEAIQNTIQTCHDKGGGRVIIPTGWFLTGPVRLK